MIKGDVRVYTKPRQLHDSVTDMPTSQVRVHHVFVLTADRRTDLVGRPLLHVHPTISMTQGDIPSPTIFNIVCDAIIRAWKVGVTDGHITSSGGVGATQEEIAAMLYADDGLLASNQPDILQDRTDYLVDLFERVGLNANTSKTKSLTCEPRPEQGPISDHAYKRRMTGYSLSYKICQRRKVTCPTCDK
jgi:hypothetical protein